MGVGESRVGVRDDLTQERAQGCVSIESAELFDSQKDVGLSWKPVSLPC